MNAEEYLVERLDDQINWYDKKSQANQRWYKRLRIAEFCLAAMIPFLAGYADSIGWIQVAVGMFGVCIAVITATLGLSQFQENWIEYRTTCESLRKERYMFLTKTEPYNGDEAGAFAFLVQRVETLVSKENTNWAQYMMKPTEEHNG